MLPIPVPGCDINTLLSLWEHGLVQSDIDRGDALLQAFDQSSLPQTLGERTHRLLNLHALLFGDHVALRSQCPACGEDAQFDVDCQVLAAQMPPPQVTTAQHLEVDGLAITFRLLDSADLREASTELDEEVFVRRLLERCVLSYTRDGTPVPADEWSKSALGALSQRLEVLDPGASVSFALRCPRCATEWQAPFDCGQLLWQKVQSMAERLLLDVDTLARAYGWTESEVLSLSPIRRAAYVQMTSS
jgi:hypothetical protein